MKLILTPEKILTQKAKPVGKIDNNIRKIAAEMKDILYQSQIGVGLAAPQVGLPLRLFLAAPDLVNPKKRKRARYFVFINPLIKQTARLPASERSDGGQVNSQQSTVKNKTPLRNPALEGCLSIPNIWGKVKRRQKVTLSYHDEKGKKWTKTFSGLLAVIVQHEMDHLQGTLFTHHVLSQGEKLYQQARDKKTGRMVMEEIHI